MFLFGHNVMFHRRRSYFDAASFQAKWWNVGRVFTINAGDIHYFTVSKWPLIFVNFEKWIDVKPTSASEDFNIV